MKIISNAIRAGVVGLMALASGCPSTSEKTSPSTAPYLGEISGTVIEEKYVPPSEWTRSSYNVLLKTSKGLQVLDMKDKWDFGGLSFTYGTSKENLDLLITTGSELKVKVMETVEEQKTLKEQTLTSRFLTVFTDDVEVLYTPDKR